MRVVGESNSSGLMSGELLPVKGYPLNLDSKP